MFRELFLKAIGKYDCPDVLNYNESFDTPQKITKEYKKGNWSYNEFNVGRHLYRMEFGDSQNTEIIFDVWKSNKWQYAIVTNNLTKSEVLALLSTIIQIAKDNNLDKKDSIFVSSVSPKKFMLYRKMFTKMFATHDLMIDEKEGKVIAINRKPKGKIPKKFISKNKKG